MPYCPRCFAEYVDGTSFCEDCGTQLLSGSPPPRTTEPGEPDRLPEGNLVAVRTFDGLNSSFEAELAQNLLREKGIPSTLSGDIAAGPFPGFPIVLLVREEDAARAAHVLEDFLGPDPDRATE
jgi:hypothetical protein